MRFSIILLTLIFVLPLNASALECGVLDFGTDVVWEYKNGQFLDINGKKISAAVPAKRKLQYKKAGIIAGIEGLGSSKSKGTKPSLKFSLKGKKGKPLQFQKKGSQFLALVDSNLEDPRFILINKLDGTVYYSAFSSSLENKKIAFTLDEEASFFEDSNCSDEDPVE